MPTRLVRLMPVGGSITYGVGSSSGNGYREFLRDLLVAKGYDISFVGSRKSGPMRNSDHEGWRGYRLDQIHDKVRASADTLLPDMFAVNAGSNDCIQNYQLDCFGRRMDALLEYFWRTRPLSTVILSTLLVTADTRVNARVMRVNDQIRQLVTLKAAEGKRISLADMYGPDGPSLYDLVDGTHPNDDGYRKMARIWVHAFQAAST